MDEKWTKTSAPPPSGLMKPKPFSPLNHFTVPEAMSAPSQAVERPHRADSSAAALIIRVRGNDTKRRLIGFGYPSGAITSSEIKTATWLPYHVRDDGRN